MVNQLWYPRASLLLLGRRSLQLASNHPSQRLILLDPNPILVTSPKIGLCRVVPLLGSLAVRVYSLRLILLDPSPMLVGNPKIVLRRAVSLLGRLNLIYAWFS